jgi:RNA polymerase primary sigma factor
MIRLPIRKEEAIRKVQKISYALSQHLSRSPQPEEIAKEAGIPVGEVKAIFALDTNPVSLDHCDDSSELSLLEYHQDYTYNPERIFMKKNSREATLSLLNSLKKREKDILVYRYQLHGGERYSFKKIGDKMGIASETVRQIEMRALRKVRESADLAEFLA